MDQISVKDMITYMESGAAFSLSYITYDAKRKKGGKVVSYSEAVLLERITVSGERTATPQEEKKERIRLLRKDPNHFKWYTRNIRLLVNGHPSGMIKKIHPPLVFLFNNKTVVA